LDKKNNNLKGLKRNLNQCLIISLSDHQLFVKTD